MKPWTKAPPELVERFTGLASTLDGVELRKMFGYPAAFVGGNMAFGLFEDRIMLRLPEAERTALLAEGWRQFEPMPGRPMREYLMPPAELGADFAGLRPWLERAAAYAESLPAKPTKPKTSSKPKKSSKERTGG